ncbi:unnamed protein product [Fructobacillus cardui]|nr:unnamed protein product [Fructobacillus cardui]
MQLLFSQFRVLKLLILIDEQPSMVTKLKLNNIQLNIFVNEMKLSIFYVYDQHLVGPRKHCRVKYVAVRNEWLI